MKKIMIFVIILALFIAGCSSSSKHIVHGKVLVSIAMDHSLTTTATLDTSNNSIPLPLSPQVMDAAGSTVAYDGENVKVLSSPVQSVISKTAVILMHLPGQSAEPFAKSDIQNLFFGTGNSIANWMKVSSDGQAIMTGNVFGYYNSTLLPGDCSIGSWLSAAQSAASNDPSSGYASGGYTDTVVIFPGQSCSYAGIAYVNSPGAVINGDVNLTTISHELGHNLGAWHAGALGTTGTFFDYGDFSDIMGNGRTEEYNAYHKFVMGWIPQSSVMNATSGSYQLTPLENPLSGGIKLLRYGNYGIDYRAGTDFDTAPYAGIHVYNISYRGTSDTWLPLMPSGSSKTLSVGQTYSDGSFSVSVISPNTVCINSCSSPPTTITTTTTTTLSPTTTTTIPPTTQISYDTGDNGNGYPIYASFKSGQTFTVGPSISISKASVLVFRKGNVGTATCSIFATSSGLPTGQPIATSTISNIGLSADWVDCNFNTTQLTQGTYALVLGWSGGNGNNVLLWRTDGTAPGFNGGNVVHSRSSGAWDKTSTDLNKDSLFRIK